MKVSISLADEKDAERFTDWQMSTADNLFDPAIATYPNLRTLRAEVDGKTAAYFPFHPVFVVESLATRPGITPKENAYALRKFYDRIEELARAYGVSEIWFQCSDPSLIRFAEKHGFTVLNSAVTLRKKVSPASTSQIP